MSSGMDWNVEAGLVSSLIESIGRINASLNLHTVLCETVDGARAIIGARYAVMVTTDRAGKPEHFVTSGLTTEEAQQLANWQPEGGQLFAHLRDLGRPFRSVDWPGYVSSIGLSPHAVLGKTFIGAPMDHHGTHVGYVFLADKDNAAAFDDECEATLMLFARQASNAIVNARAHSTERTLRADLEGVISTVPAGVIVFRQRGEGPPLINREALRLMESVAAPGQSTEAFLSGIEVCRSDGSIVTRDDLLGGETMWFEEIGLSAPDGRSVRLMANARAVRTEEGAIQAAVVALQDLEPIRRIERLHTEFLAMVSHELRVPLSAIKGAMSSLQESAHELDRAEIREFARMASEQSDIVRSLVADLLDIGRIETGTLSIEPAPSDLRAAIEQARTALSNGEAGHAIRIEVPPGLPPVMIDGNRIAQVLANFLSNAAKHAPEGSCIRVGATREDAHVTVSVRDEGSGFTSEQRPFLFRKFASGGNGADAGLGLAVSKGIVEAHGGRIWADSPGPGLGATFSFMIPVAATAQDAAGAAEPAASQSAARILVVDDDPNALRYARDALRDNGFNPLVTGDHREIPRLLRTEKPDLVLLDLVMPDADGVELLQRLPGLADLPVIVLSGYGREETIACALDAGADDYILKPCAPIELVARIRSVLRRRNKGGGFRLGELVIDYGSRQVRVGGNAVSLTTIEYELLRVLSLNAGEVVTFGALMRQVWNRHDADNPSLVRMSVSNLRSKLGDCAEKPAFIFNVRSVGYRMASPGGS